jgi:hypothetical protein
MNHTPNRSNKHIKHEDHDQRHQRRRVLPWGENPLLNWVRCHLHSGKDRTPLDRRDVDELRRHFPTLTVEGQQLLGMISRVVGP